MQIRKASPPPTHSVDFLVQNSPLFLSLHGVRSVSALYTWTQCLDFPPAIKRKPEAQSHLSEHIQPVQLLFMPTYFSLSPWALPKSVVSSGLISLKTNWCSSYRSLFSPKTNWFGSITITLICSSKAQFPLTMRRQKAPGLNPLSDEANFLLSESVVGVSDTWCVLSGREARLFLITWLAELILHLHHYHHYPSNYIASHW